MTNAESYVTVDEDGITIQLVGGDSGLVEATRTVAWESLTSGDSNTAIGSHIDETTISCIKQKPHESIDESHYASLSNESDR